jgi:thiamine biosynthesis lipoprotein
MTEPELPILDAPDISRRRFLLAVAGGALGTLFGTLSPGRAWSRTEARTVSLGRLLMGTVVEIEANHPDLLLARRAIEAGLQRMMDVDRLMSTFRPDSEISQVNRSAATFPITVGEETFGVLTEAARIGLMSGGALDVTIHPLMQLWRRATRQGRHPSSQEIDAALGLVAHSQVTIDPDNLCVRLILAGSPRGTPWMSPQRRSSESGSAAH